MNTTSDNFLDRILNTGLGIATSVLGPQPQTVIAPAASQQKTDWTKIAIGAGIGIGVITLIITLVRR